jgi:FG-GAP-like repeat
MRGMNDRQSQLKQHPLNGVSEHKKQIQILTIKTRMLFIKFFFGCLFYVFILNQASAKNHDFYRKSLPAPLVYNLEVETLILINDDSDCNYKLYIKDNENKTERYILLGREKKYLDSQVNPEAQYQYSCISEKVESKRSREAHIQKFSKRVSNYGALSIEDLNGDGIYDLLGTLSTKKSLSHSIFQFKEEKKLGLENLKMPLRKYRDIRFADFNNDGKLDAIANVYSENINMSYILLFWGTGDGTFKEDENFSEYKYQGFGETIVVADFNNDGFLDILIPQYTIENSKNNYSRNLFLKNNRDKTFKDISIESGVSNMRISQPEGAQALDFNEDGFIDVYIGGSLFLNDGDFHFRDISKEINLPAIFDEGIKFFDFNLDGKLDLFIKPPNSKPRLFINSNGKFSESSDEIFPKEIFNESYGFNLSDVNNDGFDDILIGGGFNSHVNDKHINFSGPRFYLYKEGKYIRQNLPVSSDVLINISYEEFTNKLEEQNNYVKYMRTLYWSDLVTFGDLNNDGGIDLVMRVGDKNITLFNDNVPQKYLKLTVLGKGFKNQHGRLVKINFPNKKIKTLVIDGGSGYLSNQPYELTIPNDKNEQLNIEIFCANKKIKFSANSGSYIKNCN